MFIFDCPSTRLYESALWRAWMHLPNTGRKIADWLLLGFSWCDYFHIVTILTIMASVHKFGGCRYDDEWNKNISFQQSEAHLWAKPAVYWFSRNDARRWVLFSIMNFIFLSIKLIIQYLTRTIFLKIHICYWIICMIWCHLPWKLLVKWNMKSLACYIWILISQIDFVSLCRKIGVRTRRGWR